MVPESKVPLDPPLLCEMIYPSLLKIEHEAYPYI